MGNFLDYSVEQALLASRIAGKRNSYASDNPSESTKVFMYLKGGIRPATVTTALGKHLVALEDARRAIQDATDLEAYSVEAYTVGAYSR